MGIPAASWFLVSLPWIFQCSLSGFKDGTFVQISRAEHRRDRLGQIRRPGGPRYAHTAADDKKQIQPHVQAGGKYQEKQRDLAVSHRPQICGKQVVKDVCRKSDADPHNVRVSVLEDI